MHYVPAAQEHPKTAALKRWAAWLCAYTGARVGEIVQLRKQDVREAGARGAMVITITPEAGTVKTKEMREVVLHEHLEAQGFWQFIERSRGRIPVPQCADDWAGERRGKWRAARNRLVSLLGEVVKAKGCLPITGGDTCSKP